MITLEWKNEVLRQLMSKKDGEAIQLTPTHANYEKFVEAVKIIINWQQDSDNGFCLTFNDTFTMLKKRCHRNPSSTH